MITFFYKYIAIFFVLILVSSIFGTLGQNGRELDAADGTGTATIIDDTVPVSRGGRAASTIELGSPLSLPEVDGNWTQDNWSAGSGQDQWSNPRKYSTGENVDHSAADGRLEIAKNQEIETWRYINDGPGARYRHSAAWDTNSNKMYIYGGFAGWGGARDNLFAYNAVTDEWTEKESYSPGRVGHTAVWDTLNNRMLVFGGRDSSNFPFGDLLAYNPIANNWTELNSSGPSARYYHTAVFDESAGVMIVYGGYNETWANLCTDIWVYNVSADNWTKTGEDTGLAYHAAVWNPDDGLMYTYAGAHFWKENDGFTYTDAVRNYDWKTDTWTNKTNKQGRVRPYLAFDTVANKILMYGGWNASTLNDTWFFYPEPDTWEQTIDGMRSRDYGSMVWDDHNDRLLFYGGRRGQTTYDSLWFYSEYTPAYVSNGSIESSNYDIGTPVKYRKITFETDLYEPGVGQNPVKIKFAGSTTVSGPWNFIGPDGTSGSYFSKSAGESIPLTLAGSRYIKYVLNLSTEDLLVSPIFRSIRTDYYTYKPSETFESIVYQPKYAIHKVDWNATLPTGTDAKFYLRYGGDEASILSNNWEELGNGQQVFNQAPMAFFQYRVVLSSTDPIETPVVYSLAFTLNQPPGQPATLFPGNGSHYHSATPEFTWAFTDPDGLDTDAQDTYDLQVSFRKEFDFMNYESGVVSTNISSCQVDTSLADGWYYWRVRTMDNYRTWGPWSAVHRVYIDTTPPQPPEPQSYTHPINATWYSLDNAIFDWDAPEDISGISGYSYSMNQSRSDGPPQTIMLSSNEFSLKKNSAVFEGLVEYSDLADGIWYFRVRAADTMGHWSTPFTYLLRIDTTPVDVEDFSDEQASTGEELTFGFELDDTHSGLSTTELAWRYEGELEFQKEFINIIDEDIFTFKYTMQDVDADYVEYYLTTTDNAQQPNSYRYPGGGSAQIPLTDNDPPTIINSSETFSQDTSKEMTIYIRAKDNIDITSAELYLDGEVAPRAMSESSSGYFEYSMDKDQLKTVFIDGTVAEVTYYIIINDGSNNSIRAPLAGTYRISAKESADGDTNGGAKKETTEEVQGLSYGSAGAIIAVIIVVFIVLLFMLLRKHKQKIEEVEEEQSKMRMELLGTTTEGPGAPPPPTESESAQLVSEIQGMAGVTPQIQPAIGGEPTAFGGEPTAFGGEPIADSQQQQALPPAEPQQPMYDESALMQPPQQGEQETEPTEEESEETEEPLE